MLSLTVGLLKVAENEEDGGQKGSSGPGLIYVVGKVKLVTRMTRCGFLAGTDCDLFNQLVVGVNPEGGRCDLHQSG